MVPTSYTSPWSDPSSKTANRHGAHILYITLVQPIIENCQQARCPHLIHHLGPTHHRKLPTGMVPTSYTSPWSNPSLKTANRHGAHILYITLVRPIIENCQQARCPHLIHHLGPTHRRKLPTGMVPTSYTSPWSNPSSKTANRHGAHILYITLVRPIVENCQQAWCPHLIHHLGPTHRGKLPTGMVPTSYTSPWSDPSSKTANRHGAHILYITLVRPIVENCQQAWCPHLIHHLGPTHRRKLPTGMVPTSYTSPWSDPSWKTANRHGAHILYITLVRPIIENCQQARCPHLIHHLGPTHRRKLPTGMVPTSYTSPWSNPSSKTANRHGAHILYITLVRPIVENCQQAWCPHLIHHLGPTHRGKLPTGMVPTSYTSPWSDPSSKTANRHGAHILYITFVQPIIENCQQAWCPHLIHHLGPTHRGKLPTGMVPTSYTSPWSDPSSKTANRHGAHILYITFVQPIIENCQQALCPHLIHHLGPTHRRKLPTGMVPTSSERYRQLRKCPEGH